MDYSTDLVKKIEEKAKEMMTPSEISFLLDIDETILVDDINSIGNPARRAFFKGMASTANDIRKGIRDLADAGSPFSIAECQRLITRQLAETKF